MFDDPIATLAALPCWRGRVRLSPLAGGLSNAAFRAEDDTGAYVARLGRDFPFHRVSRAREAAASRWAAEAGLSPAVLHSGEGCLVARFIEGRTLTAPDLRDRAADVVALVKCAHSAMRQAARGEAAFFWAFHVLRDYADTLRAAGHAIASELPRMMALADKLEATQIPQPIVFGHHDLLPANLIDDGKRLWLIDWEYAAFGTPMFDLANLAQGAEMDAAEGAALLEAYFGAKPDGALRQAFNAMRIASALREWLWACVSQVHLQAPGADYGAYADICRVNFESALARFGEGI